MAGFFGLGNYSAPGPGVRKDEPEKKGFAKYLDILGKRFWKMINLNFLYVLFSIIPFILMWAVCSAAMMVSLHFAMTMEEIEEWLENGGTLLMFLLALVIYANGTGGSCACGMINVLRKYVSDTHAWVWQDFIDGFKRCFKRASAAYVIDLLSAGILIVNFGFYNVQTGALAFLMRTALLFVIFVWVMMHVYIYPTITSFDFSLKDVYKNSFIMVVGKLPQTVLAFLAGAVVSGVIIIFSVAMIYIAIIVPILLFSLCEYSRLFISYPLIAKYMTDPKQNKADESHASGEAVFSDDRVEEQ